MSRKTFPFRVPHAVPLYLAPMAGVSESPFRRLCHAHGADVVVTEFLSAEGIRRENEATISKLRFSPDEHPIGVQIFGFAIGSGIIVAIRAAHFDQHSTASSRYAGCATTG